MTTHPDTVRDAIARSEIKKVDLAKRAGLHPNSLTGVERPDWNPRWNTLTALCSAAEAIKGERA